MKLPKYPYFDFYKEVENLQKEIFDCLKFLCEKGEGGKNYEGTMGVTFTNDGMIIISLDCYMIGPSRHYHWEDENPYKALNKAKKDIKQWIEEEYEHYRN